MASSHADAQTPDLARAAADLGIKLEQAGVGRTMLLLHGGGGPNTVAAFAADLSRGHHVITLTHPG